MKIAIWNTSRIVTVNGVSARLWEGVTDKGVPVRCLITTIAADRNADVSDFARDLEEVAEPSPESSIVFPFARVIQFPTKGR